MKLKVLIKVAVSALMLYLVLQNVKLANVVDTISGISFGEGVILIVGYLIGQFISSYKWWTIARHGGIAVSYRQALRAYFIGMFVNFYGFGLGTVGGDVARGLLIARGTTRKTGGLASVIADRAHGLAVLALIGLLSIAVWGVQNVSAEFSAILVVAAGSLVVGWFVGPPLMQRITPKESKIREKVDEVARVFPKDFRVLAWISALSAVFHLSQIALHGVVLYCLGVSVPMSSLLVAVPFVNILSTLPISWNGLGVREKSYIYFFSPALLSFDHAAALGTVWLFVVAVTGAMGGLFALVTDEFSELKALQEKRD